MPELGTNSRSHYFHPAMLAAMMTSFARSSRGTMVHRKPSGRLERRVGGTLAIFVFCTDDRPTVTMCGLSYVPRVGPAVFECNGYFVPILVLRRADVKHGEDARKRDEETGIDKMPCGTEPPTETERRGQQWVIAEIPVCIEETLRLEREGFRVCCLIVKHTPNDSQRDYLAERSTNAAHTMHLRLLWHLYQFGVSTISQS